MSTEVTVGIDIGTTSVKAMAVDEHGEVVARTRVPHGLQAEHAGELAHDAAEAWWDGVRNALDQLVSAVGATHRIVAVDVAAMVPSMCAVDDEGRPISVGLLYGDARGATPTDATGPDRGEVGNFLAWLVEQHPDAAGFWPAQAVANAALSGTGCIDYATTFTAMPLFDRTGWSPEVAAAAGLDDTARLAPIATGPGPIGRVAAAGEAALGPGTIDALGEQLVAGADHDGDVLVILGTTLITWVVSAQWREADGLWTTPHTAPGMSAIGGPSNAGGFFVNWVAETVGVDPWAPSAIPGDPDRIPVWLPYVRGERVPFHDPDRRGSLHDLDVGLGPDALLRAAHEASAFVVRHIIDLAGVEVARIVATGGGVRNPAWLQALADGTSLPVDVVAVPEGAALGTAWLARQSAGLEAPGASASRWARTASRVEPDPVWSAAAAARYLRFRELAG